MNKSGYEKKKVSIIVPVYNVEPYIRKCIDSLLGQTYSNIEVICVNDESSDFSSDICKMYAETDNRIKVYDIKNGGVSHARNYGLSLMTGDWFCFVDSDDWIELDYVEKMYRLAVEKQCEVVACGIEKTHDYEIKDKKEEVKYYEFFSEKECIHNFICNEHSMQGVSTNKLYKTSKFSNIRFDESLKVNEDCMYVYEIMSRCKKACLTTEVLYHWYVRKDSACHRKKTSADFSAANVFLQLYNKTEHENDKLLTNTLRMNYVSSVVRTLLFAKYEKEDESVSLAKARCKEWKKDVWKMYTIKQRIKYIYAIYLRSLGNG